MGKQDKRVDAYIDNSADFAKPILRHLRALVHTTCPEVRETIKWGFPHFDYKGIICSMASFKEHCAFGFWKAALMKDKSLLKMAASETAMGHLGKIHSVKDLPPDNLLTRYIKEAVKLNETGAKWVKPKAAPKKLILPTYFTKALKTSKSAQTTFAGFSYSNKKDYVEWVTEAKTTQTRDKRMATTLKWLAEGKVRNWKYLK